jgi:predicted Zn-dependent peptidase
MIYKETLANGLTVVTEKIPNIRSIALGFWLLEGSRHESPEMGGMHHFVEHMVFKGTERRTSHDIAKVIDSIGGTLNAFTGKENTCFYVKVLDEHLEIAMELLSDILLHPKFREEDMQREKHVVLEEIKMTEDSPDELIHNLFLESFWKDHPLSRRILGTRRSVLGISRASLQRFFRKNIVAGNLLLTAAGNLDHGRIAEMTAKYFQALRPGAPAAVQAAAPQVTRSVSARKKKGLKQVYLILGTNGFPRNHPDRYAVAVLNTFLGTGMSSRLFQKVREERSLAYDIFSDLVSYSDAGYLMVYAGTRASALPEILDIVLGEFRKMKSGEAEAEEIARAKEHLKGSLMLGLENTFNRMTNLAGNEIYFGKQFTLDEIVSGIEAVTADDIERVSRGVFNNSTLSVKILGELGHYRLRPSAITC